MTLGRLIELYKAEQEGKQIMKKTNVLGFHYSRKYIEEGKDLQGKGYDPRKLLKPGAEAIVACVKEKMELFGSVGKA